MKAKVIVLTKALEGEPKLSDFTIIEEEIPPLKTGEFLAEAEFLTVDPFQRLFAGPSFIGKSLIGNQVAKVIDSLNEDFPIGCYVVGEFGWRTHTISDATPGKISQLAPYQLPNMGDLPRSLALGVVGLTGNTALFGFKKVCKAKKGDLFVISGAGGAVGTHVGQLAKNEGCTVIGITGSDEKALKLLAELKFDLAINYNDPDFVRKLCDATRQRVDVYFDNIGGEISSKVLERMKTNGRVAVAGAVSLYNAEDAIDKVASEVQSATKKYEVHMEGFNVYNWKDEWSDGIAENLKLVQEEKLKYLETITEGFENMPRAFIGMMRGENFGKAIVKV